MPPSAPPPAPHPPARCSAGLGRRRVSAASRARRLPAPPATARATRGSRTARRLGVWPCLGPAARLHSVPIRKTATACGAGSEGAGRAGAGRAADTPAGWSADFGRTLPGGAGRREAGTLEYSFLSSPLVPYPAESRLLILPVFQIPARPMQSICNGNGKSMLRDWCQAASNHQKIHACGDHSEPVPGVTLHRVWGSCLEGAVSPVHRTQTAQQCALLPAQNLQ
ncbi:uncharacterized protein LOC132014506 [Mustela nigripes]|uniref:uncharacterized protein LOC132014506 n=1 Tax=Mustela nigripes TaxID=77151 RepID=UPI0028152708|nr:uncharacterized protein LOC132014506 [Mustela nigripes]